jgi:hypothetical protein
MFYLVIISFNLSSCFFLVNLVEEKRVLVENPLMRVSLSVLFQELIFFYIVN